MYEAAKQLDFERAAKLRDIILELKDKYSKALLDINKNNQEISDLKKLMIRKKTAEAACFGGEIIHLVSSPFLYRVYPGWTSPQNLHT